MTSGWAGDEQRVKIVTVHIESANHHGSESIASTDSELSDNRDILPTSPAKRLWQASTTSVVIQTNVFCRYFSLSATIGNILVPILTVILVPVSTSILIPVPTSILVSGSVTLVSDLSSIGCCQTG